MSEQDFNSVDKEFEELKRKIDEQMPADFENFKPDLEAKRFFMNISTELLIKILNALFKTNYPANSHVTFINSESSNFLGNSEKESLRGDLAMDVGAGESAEERARIILEFQTTADSEMGFRMLLYSFNNMRRVGDVLVMPKAMTLYSDMTNEKRGFDTVVLQFDNFWVNETEYSGDNGDRLTVKYPFINLLKMEPDDFVTEDLEALKIFHVYKYKRNIKLIKNMHEFEVLLEGIFAYTKDCNESDSQIIKNILANLLKDIRKKCIKSELFEEVKHMEQRILTYAERFEIGAKEIYERARQEEARGRAEEACGRAEAEQAKAKAEQAKTKAEQAKAKAEQAKAQAEEKLRNSAVKLLDLMGDEQIADIVGMEIDYVRQLRAARDTKN